MKSFASIALKALILLKLFNYETNAGQPITLRNAPTASSTSSPTLLIFTTYHDIRLANLSRNNVTSISVLTKDLNEGAGLDFYYDKQLICWTDQGMEAIQCRKMNESFYKDPPTAPVGIEELTDNIDKLSVITKGIEKPEGLAIDWYTDKIYWADGELNRIEVATLNGKYQKLLFWTDLDQPRAIALVPSQKLIIWTDWGESPKIERASMDGDKNSRMVLVNDRIFWPNGLTVDIENNLIYWVDGNLHFLDVMNLDGSGRRTILKDLHYPYSITYINKKLFWSDWNVGSINSYDLENGELREIIDAPDVPITVRAWDKSLQQVGPNPCRVNNGNCSHLCLLSTNLQGFSCACPTGVKLLTDTQCADGPQNVIFLVQRTQISRISLDSPDFTSFPLSLGRVRSAISIDYDPVEDFIYWSDEEQHAIKRSRQDGTSITDVINTEIKQPDGLAVDYIARNLYWADSGSDRIEVCRLNGAYRRVLIHDNLEEPRDVAVAPTLGWMFWSDWGKKPKIERASLDGTERVVLVSDDLGWPNGIALDVDMKKIYWCDAKMDKIEVTNMDGSDRRVILNENLPHVFGLSLFENFIYWTDWQRRTVERAHKITGNDRIVVVDQFPDLMGLKVTKLQEIKGTNPCMNKNGGCAHLCLNRPNDYVCRCSIDYELAKDRKACNVPTAFLIFSKGENIGRLSIGYNDEQHPDYFIPFKDLRDAYHLDVDVNERRIYWTDQKLKCISRAYINGSDVQRIVDSGIVSPEGIAVDWIAHNIYWTDADAKRIEVARLDGSSRRILIWKGIEEPKNIIVEPRKGFIYWTENPSDSIRRAALDGTDIQTIVSSANHPMSLTMDLDLRRLYWATKNDGIESADWDGKRRLKLKLAGADAEATFKPRSLTLYQDNIYWTDGSSGDIERANKVTGADRALIYKNLRDVSSLLVFHTNRQLGSNLCRVNNGGCSHLCFALPGQRKVTCACPTHFTLAGDGVNCNPPRNYLVFSQRSSFGRLLPNSSDSPDAPLPVSAKNIKAVEYDPIQHYLYWIDGRSSVRRSLDNGTKTSLVIGGSGSHSQPFDLAIDIVGRLLFWTCSHANTINITSLEGYDPIGIVDTGNSEKPRSIAVHPIRRLLFWTDVGSQQAVIRAKMDGSSSIVLANKLEGVTSLAIDPISNLVFFAHGRKIEFMEITGKNRKVLSNSNINQVHSIAAFPNVVYWLDEKFGLEKAMISGESIRLEKKYQHITDIVAVWHPEAKIIKNHLCVSQKNKCSHICIASMNNSKADEMCSCPQGLMLLKDRRNCGALPACGPDHFTCTSSFSSNGLSVDHNRDCIPSSWRCDGQNDCPDKSDELDCPTCSADQFRCNTGECIEKSFVCDGTTNCGDGLDEAMCCNPGDFQCASNQVCIPQGLLCDGWDHCADGSDESNEYCTTIAITRRANSGSDKKVFVVILIVLVLIIFFIVYVLQICRTKFADTIREPKEDQASAPLSPGGLNSLRVSKITSVADAVRLTTLSRNSMNSYDRNNITGASSSTTTNGSLIGYPSNPPPSPATTSTLHNSYPYKHYKVINQAPPTTPCSTDVCESDSNYTPISIKSSKKSGDSYTGNIYMGSISNGSNNNKSF